MKYSDFHKERTTLFYVKRDIEIQKMIGQLRPINQFITIYYGVKLR